MNAVNAPDVSAVQPPPDLRLHRLTVGQYLAIIRAGIIGEADRVELIHGWMVEKMPKRQPHNTTQMRLNRWLSRVLPEIFVVGVEIPIALADSVPEPDVSVLRGEIARYDAEPPSPDDVSLVIEIADSTLNTDRAVKRRVYAGAGIAQMWIVNLIDRQIEVYTDPDRAAGVYRAETVHPADGTIALTLDGAAIASCPVADLLP
jgi:Uma2 family endonuclease